MDIAEDWITGQELTTLWLHEEMHCRVKRDLSSLVEVGCPKGQKDSSSKECNPEAALSCTVLYSPPVSV